MGVRTSLDATMQDYRQANSLCCRPCLITHHHKRDSVTANPLFARRRDARLIQSLYANYTNRVRILSVVRWVSTATIPPSLSCRLLTDHSTALRYVQLDSYLDNKGHFRTFPSFCALLSQNQLSTKVLPAIWSLTKFSRCSLLDLAVQPAAIYRLKTIEPFLPRKYF